MTIGEKIKKARKSKGMTQEELAADRITRNMLSAIENGKASPSLETLVYIARALDISVSYLISDDDNLFFYQKKENIGSIKEALKEKKYNRCINLILKLEEIDDELAYILTVCYFELGVFSLKNGSLQTAEKNFYASVEYSKQTVYDTSKYIHHIPLYLAVCKNVSAPLLEFEKDKFIETLSELVDLDFYKYIVLDLQYEYINPLYSKHMSAKQLIKDRKYTEALDVLLEIEAEKTKKATNAYLMFCVYGDLEVCYRQLYDFENAYRYSSKRISLLEGFKS